MKTTRLVAGFVAATVLAGCATSSIRNYDRHSMSRLYASPTGDEIIFEASVTPDYPSDSLDAEAARMEWVELWLAQRKYCANGFDVVDRVRIGSAADNPYQHDLRYTIRCKSGSG